MKIDMSKVNLTERDIEDWLYENPWVIKDYLGHPISQWIGRQYGLPSGIADLIGMQRDGTLVVVEVKNVAINKAAVLQVCRYAYDLECIIDLKSEYPGRNEGGFVRIVRMLIGPSIDDQTFAEAMACDVRVVQFNANLSVNFNELHWSPEHRGLLLEKYTAISNKSEWDMYGKHWIESLRDSLENKDKYDELMDAISEEEDTSDGDE